MKIGIVCPYNIFIPGGVQEFVAHQAAELRRRGHEVTVITPRPHDYTADPPPHTTFIGQSRRIKTPGHTSADVTMGVSNEVIDQFLGEANFDVLHLQEPLLPLLGMQILARASCPTIGTFHAAMPDTLLIKSLVGSIGPYKRGIIRALGAITAVSWSATSTLEHEIDHQKIHIIPNGIDLKKYHVSPESERLSQTIFYMGRLEKRKGVRYLIDAFALVQGNFPESRLVIAGDGPERKMLENRVKTLKLRGVSFLGFISEAEKLQWLARCTIFTSPALYGESFGIVLLEAMATGAVTVAGDNPGYASVLKDTGRLSLVDARRTAEYAKRLELLMTERDLQEVWRGWASRAITQYSYVKIVDSFEAIYQELLSS